MRTSVVTLFVLFALIATSQVSAIRTRERLSKRVSATPQQGPDTPPGGAPTNPPAERPVPIDVYAPIGTAQMVESHHAITGNAVKPSIVIKDPASYQSTAGFQEVTVFDAKQPFPPKSTPPMLPVNVIVPGGCGANCAIPALGLTGTAVPVHERLPVPAQMREPLTPLQILLGTAPTPPPTILDALPVEAELYQDPSSSSTGVPGYLTHKETIDLLPVVPEFHPAQPLPTLTNPSVVCNCQFTIPCPCATTNPAAPVAVPIVVANVIQPPTQPERTIAVTVPKGSLSPA